MKLTFSSSILGAGRPPSMCGLGPHNASLLLVLLDLLKVLGILHLLVGAELVRK